MTQRHLEGNPQGSHLSGNQENQVIVRGSKISWKSGIQGNEHFLKTCQGKSLEPFSKM